MTSSINGDAAQLVLDLPHRTARDRSDFFIAPSNQIAVDMIDAWQSWQPPVLLLLGAKGSGKTHLAHVWQAQSGAVSFYDDPEGAAAFVFADDIDKKIASMSEANFLTALNTILHSRQGERGLLLTASKLEWWAAVQLPDLRSRLSSIPCAEIQPPDEQILAAVLVKLFSDRQLQVSDSLIQFLLLRIERSFEALVSIVEKLDRESAKQNKPITTALARSVLF